MAEWRCRLAGWVVAGAAFALVGLGCSNAPRGAAKSARGVSAQTAPCRADSRIANLDLREPHAFFSVGRGLWIERLPDSSACIRLVPARSASPVQPLVRVPPAASVGASWATDETFLTDIRSRGGEEVCELKLSRSPVWCVPGRVLGVFRDGAVVILDKAELSLLAVGGRRATIGSRRLVDEAAGFKGELRSMESGTLGAQPGQFTSADWIAVVAHRGGKRFRERVLVIDRKGRVHPAGPLFRHDGEIGSAVGGLYWNPLGSVLWETTTRPDPTGQWDHDHCLDLWSASSGYKREFCVSDLLGKLPYVRTAGHFVGVRWGPRGRSAVLSNGWVLRAVGRPTGRILRGPNGGFAVAWRGG